MAKAIIWVRSSTTKQECESQREELIKTATSEPYKFKKTDLIEIGKVGASAIKLNEVYRQEVDQLLDAIENEPELSTIFVWEVSRLARNEQAFVDMKNRIIGKRIQLICNVPQIKLLNDDGEVNQGMEITLNLLVTLAKQEMDIKKKRFARGKRQKAKEGKYSGGRIPFGYRAYPEKDNFIDTDDKEAEIVKLIYDMYEEGYSQPRIAMELNERGYTNPRYKEPKLIQLGQIANILNNVCYTGVQLEEKVVTVKDKSDDIETKWIRYSRKFPQIISVEQYNRCRDIAKANRTITGKGKNIYYATKLVKCETCGCFWSASGSKVDYHCYNAIKPTKLWAVNGRTTEQCQDKTSLSINILDSVLWYFAKREEAGFILSASSEQIENLKKKKADYQNRINSIPSQITRVNAEIEKLALRNAEGYLSDETFEKKVANKNLEKSQLIDKKLSYQKEIEETEKAIKKIEITLKEHGFKDKHFRWIDINRTNANEFTKQYNEIYDHISHISDDAERFEIIHRMIDRVRVKNVNIKYKFKIGWRDTRAKMIELRIKNWEINNREPRARIYTVYYLPFNGRGYGMFLEDYTASSIGLNYCWVADYNEYGEAQFEYPENPVKVRIIDIPYLNRYTDNGKNKRREKEREEAYKSVDGYLRIEDVMTLCDMKYNQVYAAIKRGELKALIIRHKFFISPKEVEGFVMKVKEKRSNREASH